jgi:signal transduction histidine kinase
MPGKSGVTMLTEVRERWPAIVRILITAYTDIDSAVAAVNAGAVYKYINKPADFPLLRQTLTEAVNLYRETLHRDALAKTLAELQEQRKATEASEAQREQLQQRLLAASRAAGRAEVATGILHNVGNVLNSINVSASVVSNTLQNSRVSNLCKGLAILEEHAGDLASFLTTDERGQRLPGYLSKLSGVLTEEQKAIGDAMVSLTHNIDHVVQVVKGQQSYAREVNLRQKANPAELMEQAVRVAQAAIDQHAVAVSREFAPLPTVLLDQHSVLQILINLVTNAANALKESSAAEKRITLKIGECVNEGRANVFFEVTDNGVGILPENLTRMFTYGFTTRKEGHGFGLHSAANAAREMGGSLIATSGGPNLGATFRLELPILQENDELKPAEKPAEKASV